MILGTKQENIVFTEETSNNKLLDFWYRYNRIIVILVILLVFALIVLLLVNSSNRNKDTETDDSAYIGIETIMIMNAKKYVTNNKLKINEVGKYLSLNYLNLIVKEEYHCNSNSGVQITNQNKEIIYTPYLVCDEYKSNAIKKVIEANDKVKEIQLLGSNPYFISKNYRELGYNINEDYTANITGINDIEPGVNLIKYNVLKNNGYYKSINRIVIAENIRGSYPELILIGKNIMTIPKGSTYKEQGYKAIDKIDGTITDRVVVTNNIDTNKAGTYYINYSITNNRKLTTTLSRTIIVNDEEVKLDIKSSIETVGEKAIIKLVISGDGYTKTVMPNKEESFLRESEYTVYENGTYSFIIYDKNNNSEVFEVKIDTLDQTPPEGSCTASYNNGQTKISVSATDKSGIDKYIYVINGKSETLKTSTYTYNGNLDYVTVEMYDPYNNHAKTSCVVQYPPNLRLSGAYREAYIITPTLQIAIENNKDLTLITKIWAKDPVKQLKKYALPKGSSVAYNAITLMKMNIKDNNLYSKAVLAGNASGIVFGDYYGVYLWCNEQEFRATEPGNLLITNGKVMRNMWENPCGDYATIYYIDGNQQLRWLDEAAYQKGSELQKAFQNVIDSGAQNTFAFHTVLIKDGKINPELASYEWGKAKAKRQVFCQIDNNNFVLLSSKYGKINLEEAASILLNQGCKTAVNFDGGGSTSLLVKNKNTSSYDRLTGGTRIMGNIFYFTELD